MEKHLATNEETSCVRLAVGLQKTFMLKPISEITPSEAEEILEFVYPNQTPLGSPKNYQYWVIDVEFSPIVDDKGLQQISFGGRPIMGIMYHNGQDRCILHWDNSKVVLWLYRNGFDIENLLEMNSYFSEMESTFDNFAFGIETMSRGADGFKEEFKHNWTLEYVQRKCREYLDKYYYRDYR